MTKTSDDALRRCRLASQRAMLAQNDGLHETARRLQRDADQWHRIYLTRLYAESL